MSLTKFGKRAACDRRRVSSRADRWRGANCTGGRAVGRDCDGPWWGMAALVGQEFPHRSRVLRQLDPLRRPVQEGAAVQPVWGSGIQRRGIQPRGRRNTAGRGGGGTQRPAGRLDRRLAVQRRFLRADQLAKQLTAWVPH
jgi:hypothetical protein